MTSDATLSHDAARALYDRIGSWLDTQRFYEDVPIGDLIAHADLSAAHAVFEFGVGTGRLAERLLRAHLPPDARYHGVDLSPTMVALARRRLAAWPGRAVVEQIDGSARLAAGDGRFDRFVSTFVFDLLSRDDIALALDEAHRLLAPDGLLCLVSATHGRTALERAVMGLAGRLHALSPSLVGGCRAIDLESFVVGGPWRVRHRRVIGKWGVTSEILIAAPEGARP